jgi:hypothetical protein
MLRFVPDSWAEGLLRPLFMAEPVAGLYLEDAAPDWRFAAFIVLAGTLLLVRKRVQPAPTLQQTVTGLGLVLLLYVWTFVVGNGRYFAWALLLIGPLMVAACALLPLSRSMRWALILLLLAVQGVSVYLARTPNHWALVRLGDDSPPALAPRRCVSGRRCSSPCPTCRTRPWCRCSTRSRGGRALLGSTTSCRGVLSGLGFKPCWPAACRTTCW